MNESLVILLVFAALTLGGAAIIMIVRDLFVPSAAGGSGAASASAAPLRLRRLRTLQDPSQAPSMVGRFDAWFHNLVLESGLDWSMTTAVLLLLMVGLLLGGALFVWFEAPLPATIGMFVGMGLVLAYMLTVRSRRINLLQDQLPPALEMLSRAVHAGESLEQAVRLVGQKSPEPLAIEFRRCSNQLEMGLSLAAVMRSLVKRLKLLDVQIFTTTLTVHRQAGGNLAETLERLAAVIRDRLNARRQLRATTASGRLSATFLLVLGPAVFAYMFFVQRDYISSLLTTSMGQSMLILAVVLELVGLIWIMRMVRDDT